MREVLDRAEEGDEGSRTDASDVAALLIRSREDLEMAGQVRGRWMGDYPDLSGCTTSTSQGAPWRISVETLPGVVAERRAIVELDRVIRRPQRADGVLHEARALLSARG
jgi:hypothetical protein